MKTLAAVSTYFPNAHELTSQTIAGLTHSAAKIMRTWAKLAEFTAHGLGEGVVNCSKGTEDRIAGGWSIGLGCDMIRSWT